MFRGLFIGIDRYPAPIMRLTCAVPDARALATLFEDNTAGQFTSLLDGQATLANMRASLEALTTAAPDDFVVVSFSGHGSDDHRLIPFDASVDSLADSCMSLEELAERSCSA